MTFHPQICTKKSSKWSKYSKLCVVGIQIRKYILKWICVYRINFLIRNSKIQANYTAKVKVVRESPHYVCNAHFHWLWRRKFAALKSLRLCHESRDDVKSSATRRSNIMETFWNVFYHLEWIRMVIRRFGFEWFACINWIILRSQIPVLPLRWRVAVKLNLRT